MFASLVGTPSLLKICWHCQDFWEAITCGSWFETNHNEIWKHLNSQMYGLPWHPKSWLKSLSKKSEVWSWKKNSNVSENHVKSLRGIKNNLCWMPNYCFPRKIQWLLCWSQLCHYKSTDFFCATLDLQCCNQPYSLVGSAAAKELYFITQAHLGDFSLCCHTASGLSSESRAWRFSMSNSCFFEWLFCI